MTNDYKDIWKSLTKFVSLSVQLQKADIEIAKIHGNIEVQAEAEKRLMIYSEIKEYMGDLNQTLIKTLHE